MCCKGCSAVHRRHWIFSIAILICLISAVMLLLWPKISEYLVHKDLILEVGTQNYKNWLKTPIPIYLKFYLFNWTNPHEIRNNHIKPRVVQMGPYVFLEQHSKENVTFYSNYTVSYYQRRTWHFIPYMSNGSLDDFVTAPHVITAAVADEMRNKNYVIKKIINFILNHEGGKLAVTKSVREWIFDGYQDNLIDFIHLFNTTKIDMPYKRFGWMVDRNNSLEYDGMFTIHTGKDDIQKLGMINHWNGRNETGFYSLPCGLVNGTAGDIFPPNLQTESYLTVFTTDACRYLNLKMNESRVNVLDIETIKWQGIEETLDSGKNFPSQKCFCNKPSALECNKSGISNCKKCRHHAPIYASYPHFLLADPYYQDAVTGLQPDPFKHTFSLAVEPITGIPVEIKARLQINLLLSSDSDFDIYRNIPNVLIPLFWFEEIATLNKELADKTKVASNLERYGRYNCIGFLCFGLLLLIYGIYVIWFNVSNEDQNRLINNAEYEDSNSNESNNS